MSLTILRWKGGFAGDMTLRMILDSNIDSKSNVGVMDMNESAGMELTAPTTGTELDSLLKQPEGDPNTDVVALRTEVDRLRQSSDQWFLKSHYYGAPEFNSDTVDIIADKMSLPFIVKSNILKCPPPRIDENVNAIIKDDTIRKKYYMYCLAEYFLNNINISNRTITVSTIISGHDTLSYALEKQGVNINKSTKSFYQKWSERNKENFPSDRYTELVKEKKFDYLDQTLTLSERYSLLAQSGDKFKILA